MKQCPDCKLESFVSKGDLYRHRRRVHGFVRCTCNRDFLKTEYMEQHKRMTRKHKPNKGLFRCSDCLRRFTKSCYLTKHQEVKGHDGMDDVGSVPDLYTLKSSEIDSFIADHVQADDIFLDCCGEVINTLVRKLQEIKKFSERLQPRRIIKSGSMGKSTAVKDIADIDLVLMLNEYTDVDQLMLDSHMDDLLEDLKDYLINNTEARHLETTRYSIQVETTCPIGHTHRVDILPAVDLLGLEFSPNAVFKKMKGASKKVIHEYSVTLAPLQRRIISALPPKVKNLIKLVKYWKDKKLKEKNKVLETVDPSGAKLSSFSERLYKRRNWPSSYALELVVINAWNECGNPESFDTAQILYTVLTSLVNHERFKIILKKQMKYSMDLIGIRESPYIMDPANPFNDMYHGLVGGRAFDWEKAVSEATAWREKPLFDYVSKTSA